MSPVLEEKIEVLQQQALAQIEQASNLDELEALRVKYLGRSGSISGVLKQMGSVEPERRPVVGKLANQARAGVEQALGERQEQLEQAALARQLEEERVDVTLPGVQVSQGALHPVTRTFRLIEEIFRGLGFQVASGPEVEWEELNFDALNIGPDHPARDMHDTFYIDEEILLRTHTSPVQIRTMRELAPSLPVRIIVPGRVYRRDDDATHSPMFHQVEGLSVDRGISMAHLRGTMAEFAREVFGPDTGVRFRPSYFPFTEPSAEIDITCSICGGSGCRTCGDSGWVEIGGSGMVHPVVLENGGYDPGAVSGWAFGIGVDRIAMMLHGIDDLRLIFQNDIRFLAQFR